MLGSKYFAGEGPKDGPPKEEKGGRKESPVREGPDRSEEMLKRSQSRMEDKPMKRVKYLGGLGPVFSSTFAHPIDPDRYNSIPYSIDKGRVSQWLPDDEAERLVYDFSQADGQHPEHKLDKDARVESTKIVKGKPCFEIVEEKDGRAPTGPQFDRMKRQPEKKREKEK